MLRGILYLPLRSSIHHGKAIDLYSKITVQK